MKQLWRSALIMFLLADGVLLIVFGRRWVRFTRFGPGGSAYVQVMDWFLEWPAWLLRVAGLVETGIALKLIARWQPGQGQETASG